MFLLQNSAKKVEIAKVKTIFLQAKLSSHKAFCPQGVLVDFTFEHVIPPYQI